MEVLNIVDFQVWTLILVGKLCIVNFLLIFIMIWIYFIFDKYLEILA